MADGRCNNPNTNEELKPSLFLFCEEAHAPGGRMPKRVRSLAAFAYCLAATVFYSSPPPSVV